MEELIPTRATLLQRLKNWQDQASWQDFYHTYSRLIHTIALRGGLTETEAQDVVQETMFAAAKQLPDFKYDPQVGSFKGWLLNITRWRIIDHHRRRKDHRSLCENTGGGTVGKIVDPSSRELDRLWDTEWRRNLVEVALTNVKRRVEPTTFQMFDLYMNKEWEAARVAEAFGVPIERVYLAKHRVSDFLKEEIRRLELEVA